MAWIVNLTQKHGQVPTRDILKDTLIRQLTTDDPYEDVLKVVDRKSNPRETGLIRDQLWDWLRVRAYGLLYNEETILAYQRGDFSCLDKLYADVKAIDAVRVNRPGEFMTPFELVAPGRDGAGLAGRGRLRQGPAHRRRRPQEGAQDRPAARPRRQHRRRDALPGQVQGQAAAGLLRER
jgi:hypothetical protein